MPRGPRPDSSTALHILVLALLLSSAGCLDAWRDAWRDVSTPFPREDGPPRFRLEAVVPNGLDQPLLVTHAGDGSGRLFIVEQGGLVRVLRDGALEAEPFLDVRDRTRAGGERGLLGLAFHLRFAENGVLFASYTDLGGDSVIESFRADPPDAGRVDTANSSRVFFLEQPFGNHNGGHLAFGPDGYLYVSLGDGGGAGDPRGHGQNARTLHGSILRLDVDRHTLPEGEAGAGYSIPPDNPFVGSAGADEIWAFGLRNPWRFSFDRVTGDLWIADVGQNSVEEVNRQPAESSGGENYGWPVWEGSRRFGTGSTLTDPEFPIVEYARRSPHCSITGGYVYRGSDVPALEGVYLFGDYCSGFVWGVWQENGTWITRQLVESGLRISSFGEDEDGELYVVDHWGGVHRVVAIEEEAAGEEE